MCLKSRRGNVLFEFALAGIPIMLLIISVIEISRGLWTYCTLSYAVTEGSRRAIVGGADCGITPNLCTTTVSIVAAKISTSSVGLLSSRMNVTLSSTGGGVTYTCNPLSTCILGTKGSAPFPQYPGNAPGSDVIVTAYYPFQSPLTMFFPGLTSPTGGITTTLHATSQEPIQF
jgi:Flp pilus assembly protein TadG